MAIKNFKFEEFLTTSTLFSNIPDWEQIENIKFVAGVLQIARTKFGKAIKVNSAFRSAAVNKAVGGSNSSAHLKGLAADICAYSGTETDNRKLYSILEKNIVDWNIDQLIMYNKTKGDKTTPIRFIHVGFKANASEARHQKLFY